MSSLADYALLANGGGGIAAPFHPMLVNFTAALVPVSFLFDLMGLWLGKEQLRAVGWWTLLSAAALTPFTALAGWMWMRSMDHAQHGAMGTHQWLGISLAVAIVALAAWRGWLHWHVATPRWLYAAAAVIVLGALVYQGELGASMSFGRGIVLSSGADGGHEHGGAETPGHGDPSAQQAEKATQNHGHGEHGHGDAAEWRDHLDVKESP